MICEKTEVIIGNETVTLRETYLQCFERIAVIFGKIAFTFLFYGFGELFLCLRWVDFKI